jgi:hypothetical protein
MAETIEEWRAIPGYEGSYEVSNLGRVRSLDRITDRGRRWRGRLMNPCPLQNGYLIVTLWRDGKQRTPLVHRLVLLAFVGPATDSYEALHANGDRADNRIANLSWGTHSNNQFDQVAHGTHPQASKTHCPQGHPYNDENTYHVPGRGAHRTCRTCRREYQRNYKPRKKAA